MARGELGFKSFTFFMLQPFGITIEVLVSYLWRRFQRDERNPTAKGGTGSVERAQGKYHNDKPLGGESIPPLWIRCVGSIWLTLWILWTAAYLADASLSTHPGQILNPIGRNI
jgi:hypothetical protein